MLRRDFIQNTVFTTAALVLNRKGFASDSHRNDFPVVRVPAAQRKFTSTAVENVIRQFQASVPNKELGWLFGNCFPNTLDSTVDFELVNGRPDTYVITGDIDAMWLRDSTAQVWPYLHLVKEDAKLQQLIAGVINRQVKNILLDPYANAFYKDATKISEWKDDLTDMKPGIHERKWEIDSLCYPIRLSYHYWKITGDTSPFDSNWKKAVELVLNTFKEQQRKHDKGPYKFERRTSWATDGVPLGGYGYPAKPVGLIFSMFRPSDDATIFPFLIPANFFAVVSMQQAADMLKTIYKDETTAAPFAALATEVGKALQQYAIVQHPVFGKVYAYEINALGSYNLMDDANVPGLLSLPYLGAVKTTDPVYINTRKLLLSEYNPFFFKGSAGEGIGGPHAGIDLIWPMSITIRGMTSTDDKEIRDCVRILQHSHAGTGFMHETFHKNDVNRYTRKWFAWGNTIFGEFLFETWKKKPHLLT
jgi:meiotically up-regulated gene 157 (Mug157) protein